MRKMLLIAGTLVVLAAFTGGAKASTLTVYSGGGQLRLQFVPDD